jgi:hypothetical protein
MPCDRTAVLQSRRQDCGDSTAAAIVVREGGAFVEDANVLDIIRALVDEERELRERDREGLDATERQRMAEIETALDQCWDYLRQRRAAREFGRDPGQAHTRTPETVERYLQ